MTPCHATLARDGDPHALYVAKKHDDYAIGRQGRRKIDGDQSEYEDNDAPDKVTIHGFAISLVLRMMEKLDRLGRNGDFQASNILANF